MAKNSVEEPFNHNTPIWIIIVLQDSIREDHDAMPNAGMVGETGRAIVWSMCENFDCVKLGVPGQICRLFERYLANLQMVANTNNLLDKVDYMSPRVMLSLGCCLQIAMKTVRSKVSVSASDMRDYLESLGALYTISEIRETEREMFRGIGYHVPLYNSVDMAELLADHLNVDQGMLEVISSVVQLAERKRHDIEKEMRYIAADHSSIPFPTQRVRTVHLAAGCVAAAVRKDCLQTSNNVAIRLATLLHVTVTYIMVLRDVVLISIAPPEPPARKHRPNILRKKFAAKASEPLPSTSKSTPF